MPLYMLYCIHKHEQLLMCSKNKKRKGCLIMKKTFKLQDLDCANCAAKLERTVQQVEGVLSATVSFMTQKLTIEIADENFDAVWKEVKKKAKKVNRDVTIIE